MEQMLIQSLSLGLISSSFSLFLSYCYGEDEILWWWGKAINKLPNYLANPLGACVYCQSTWVALFLCALYSPNLLVSMGAIGFNYVLLQIYFKYIDN